MKNIKVGDILCFNGDNYRAIFRVDLIRKDILRGYDYNLVTKILDHTSTVVDKANSHLRRANKKEKEIWEREAMPRILLRKL